MKQTEKINSMPAKIVVVVLFSLSVMSNSTTPWTVERQHSLSFTISWNLVKLMSIESVMPSNHLVLCRPFLILHSIFPSISVFSNESAPHNGWLKYWSFSFSISPSLLFLCRFDVHISAQLRTDLLLCLKNISTLYCFIGLIF